MGIENGREHAAYSAGGSDHMAPEANDVEEVEGASDKAIFDRFTLKELKAMDDDQLAAVFNELSQAGRDRLLAMLEETVPGEVDEMMSSFDRKSVEM